MSGRIPPPFCLFPGPAQRLNLKRGAGSPVGVIAVSTFLSSRNEPGNAGLYNGIKSDPRLDSFANLPHGVLRKGGDFKVLLDPAGGLRGGQEGRPALDSPGEQDLRGALLTRLAIAAMTGSSSNLGSLLCPSAAKACSTMRFFLQYSKRSHCGRYG